MLNRDTFRKILHHFSFEPSADLVASRLNNQLPHYVAYHPVPGALQINAFTVGNIQYMIKAQELIAPD